MLGCPIGADLLTADSFNPLSSKENSFPRNKECESCASAGACTEGREDRLQLLYFAFQSADVNSRFSPAKTGNSF